MQCYDRIFQKVDVFDEAGEKLSRAKASHHGAGAVKSKPPAIRFLTFANFWRRYIYKWVVESPGGREVCVLRHSSFRQCQALDVIVHNQDDKGKEVSVDVRPKDQVALTRWSTSMVLLLLKSR
jgi:hypothetical protein